MKQLKKLTVLFTMILCIFSVMSLSPVKASAATNVAYARNAYMRAYSNGCIETYMTITYNSGQKITTSTNISWLVKKGASSNSIKMLQASLNTVGTSSALKSVLPTPLDVDGIWGPATEAALRSYQSWKSGCVADGICGPSTWNLLTSDVIATNVGGPVTRI